jgi:predicted AAA+ superfamily ATPase
MTTLTIDEKEESTNEVNFLDLLIKKGNKVEGKGEYQFSKYLKHILQGGWPSLIGLQQEQINIILNDYLENIADVDMRNITQRPSKERTLALITALAKNVSCNVTFEKLSKEAKIIDSAKTIRNYLDFFNRIFLIFELPA